MPIPGAINGAGSAQRPPSPDQTALAEPNSLLAKSLTGAWSETGRFEPTTAAAQAEPTAVEGASGIENNQDCDELLQPPVQPPIAAELARVSINDGSADDGATTLQPLAPEALRSLEADQELADSLEDASISPDEGIRAATGNAGGSNGHVLEGMTDAAIHDWQENNREFDELMSNIPDPPGGSEEPGSSISSGGSDVSGEPEGDSPLDVRLSEVGRRLGILPGNDAGAGPGDDSVPAADESLPAIVAQPNAIAVATKMSCQDQFREDALKFLFAHSPNADALSKAYEKEQGNPAAKITIARFAEQYMIACEALKSPDADDKNFRQTRLDGAAKDYVALIEKHGAGKKSVFGAFYLGSKTALKARLAVEARLCKYAGAETPGGRAALTRAAITSRVAPYIEKYLSENLGGNVTGLAEDAIEKMIESQARYALEQISAASENLIKRDGASAHNIAARLEMLMVWPELLRSFMDGSAPPTAVAAHAAEETDAADDAASEGVPEVDDDPSASGEGQPGATYVTNNYVTNDNSVTDNSVHIADSYNQSRVNSTDRQIFASDVQPDAYSVADPDPDLDLDDGTGSVNGNQAASENGDQYITGRQSGEFVVDDDFEDAGNLVAIDDHFSVADDLGSDEVDLGSGNPQLASTEARPNSILVPIRPYVSSMPRYGSEPYLSGVVTRNREEFERSLSDYGSGTGPIQFATPGASLSDTDLSLKTVVISRKTEEERKERLTSLELAAKRSIEEHEERKRKSPSRVILTVSRYDEYRSAGGWSRQESVSVKERPVTTETMKSESSSTPDFASETSDEDASISSLATQ
jgi:hypothetical protein